MLSRSEYYTGHYRIRTSYDSLTLKGICKEGVT